MGLLAGLLVAGAGLLPALIGLAGLPPLVGLVLLAGASIAILAVSRPLAGLGVFVFISFARIPSVGILGPVTAQQILAFLVLLGSLMSVSRLGEARGRQLWIFRDRSFRVLVLFTSLVWLSSLAHGSLLGEPYAMVNNLMLIGAMAMLVRNWRELRGLAWAAFAGSVVTVLGGFITWLHDGRMQIPPPRLNGYYGLEIIMALIALLGACLGIALARGMPRSVGRTLALLASGLCAAMVASGASRGVLAAGLVLVVWLMMRSGTRTPLRVAVVVLLLGMAALSVYDEILSGTEAVVSAAQSPEELQAMSSGRTLLYKAAIRLIPVNPLTGIGWNQFRYRWHSANPAYFVRVSGVPELNVHCSYLQVLVELGILGFAVYAYWTFLYIKAGVSGLRALSGADHASRSARYLQQGFLFSVVGLLLHSVVDNVARGSHRLHLLLVGMLLVGAHLALAEERRRRRRE